MADANELVRTMKRAAAEAVEAGRPVSIVFGQVLGVNPLTVMTEQKMQLGANQLVLSRNVTDFVAAVTVSWETGEQGGGSGEAAYEAHRHRISGTKQITIHNALKPGERVILLRKQGGQEYIVLDRTGGVG